MQSVEPVLENAIKTLQKVVDVRGMGKALVQLQDDVKAPVVDAAPKILLTSEKDPAAAITDEEKEEIIKSKETQEAAKAEEKDTHIAAGLKVISTNDAKVAKTTVDMLKNVGIKTEEEYDDKK